MYTFWGLFPIYFHPLYLYLWSQLFYELLFRNIIYCAELYFSNVVRISNGCHTSMEAFVGVACKADCIIKLKWFIAEMNNQQSIQFMLKSSKIYLLHYKAFAQTHLWIRYHLCYADCKIKYRAPIMARTICHTRFTWLHEFQVDLIEMEVLSDRDKKQLKYFSSSRLSRAHNQNKDISSINTSPFFWAQVRINGWVNLR